MALSVLLAWHIYLILRNKTTIEVHKIWHFVSFICLMANHFCDSDIVLFLFDILQYHEGVRAMWLAEKGGDDYSHPYDLGAYENLISVASNITLFHLSAYTITELKKPHTHKMF